jgi:hypothetical protein
MLAGFRGCERAGFVVGHVPPRKAVADHFHVDEARAQVDAANFALVAVDVDDLDADRLAEHFVSKILLRLDPERLVPFSGASIPASQILCCTLSASRMVSVSPSAIFTTLPVSV